MVFKIFAATTGAILAGIIGIAIVIVGIFAMFLFAILGALVGAITGWIVSIVPFLGDLVREGFAQFGIANANLTAIGAMLGFVAGFFKSIGHDKCKEE
jgi:hypothetical protein